MTKILVCGAKGQLGSSIRDLSGNYPDLQIIYTDVEELDILDSLAVSLYIKETKPAYIINCAAFTMVDRAESEKEKSFRLNADAVKILHQAAQQADSKLIHISTDYVFNGKSNRPYVETDLPEPDSVYGIGKLKGEMFLIGSDRALIIRTSWLYSSYGHNFLKTVLRLGNERPEIKMVCDQIGTPTFAGDLADAILLIIQKCESGKSDFLPGIYHYSNEGVASWYDFAMEIINLAGLNAKVIPIETFEYPLPAHRPAYSVLNKKKIIHTFGITVRHWKEALRECLEGMGMIRE
jgi:dTDP-4-dehydrorhamnose reductase